MAASANVKRVILTHFRRHMDTHFAPDQVKIKLNWKVAEDLDVFDI